MKKKALHIMALSGALFYSMAHTYAQPGFFVPQTGKIYFSGNTSTIFSDVTNKGQMGVGKDAVVNFKGRQWSNDPSSTIPDESLKGSGTIGIGGIIRFLIPDSSLPIALDQQQTIIGGYNAAIRTGPSFPNLYVGNPWGVQLSSGSTKIRRELHFSDGNLYANNNILVVGDRNPGIISGYNEDRFVVTGTSPTGGLLLREKIGRANGLVVFPIGTADGKYTPAALHMRARRPDDFYARVFDSVLGRITDGTDLSERSVGKTWQIGKMLRPGEDVVDLVLQHRFADEGNLFIAHREVTYVSQYVSGSWDSGFPQTRPEPGTLTSGPPIVNSGTNSRAFRYSISPSSYFTKFAGFEDTTLNRTNLWFNAYRTDHDNVWVYWTTRPEIRNKYFVVQRRLIYELGFTNRDTILSRAPGGISFNFLDYTYNDPNSYTGTSLYRLMMVDYNGNITYSNVIAVGGEPEGFGWTLWPNPSPGRFFVGISRPPMVKYVCVWDFVGRLLRREFVSNRGLIEMHLRVKGAYVIGLIPFDGSHMETKKLVVIGD